MSSREELESPRLDEVRIEMDDLSRQSPSPEDTREEQRNENEPTHGISNAEMEGAETVLPRPERWNSKSLKNKYPRDEIKGDPWETVKVGVDKLDKEMCDAWNGELDTMMTFTGLFSAAVTAFCIDSFQSLSQSSADTTNIFLVALSQQLANSSSPVAGFSMVEDFTPSAHDVYANTLYFISLTLALSVSSVCILGKQWIREYQKDISVSAKDAIRLRQARFDSLEAWKVPQIMAALPVVLLAALTLFFAGLLIQLWKSSNPTPAIAVSIVVACTVLLFIVTTVVPALCSMQRSRAALTPFRSPQAWFVFVVYRQLQQWYHALFHVYNEAPSALANWSAFDHHFLETEAEDWFEHEVSSVHRALRWAYDVLRNSSLMDGSIYWCLQKQTPYDPLVKSQDHLIHYVLSGSSEVDQGCDNIYSVLYDYSRRTEERNFTMDDPVGRYQAELLIQSAYAMRHATDPWGGILDCYRKLLRNHRIVDCRYYLKDSIHHQFAIQDQLALLLEWIFTIPSPPAQLSYRYAIIHCLLRTCGACSSPIACQILDDIVRRQIPQWIRTNNSASLLDDIGCATYGSAMLSWKHSFVLFVGLAEVMAEMSNEAEGMAMWGELEGIVMWNELEGVDELDELVLGSWMEIHDWFRRKVLQRDEPKI